MSNESGLQDSGTLPEESDGKHLEILRYALSVAVKKIGIGSDSMYARFQHHFHPIYKKNPDAFRTMYLELTRQVESNFNEEVKQIFDEEKIPILMNELDKLIDKAYGDINSSAWRPTGDPVKDSVAHTMPVKLKHKMKLEKMVTELESVNKMLKDAHEKKQKKLIKTKQKIDKISDKWSKDVEDIQNADMKDIDLYLEKHKEDL
ncbi:PMF1 [Mytilus coruscus]|uniref:PMF1 n=1 Tax=Mytilus coruscus TaxID=42192 RepID=A0A6J8ANQ8_MYTCO|nr:PMF1 [Mytilus coruscus]